MTWELKHSVIAEVNRQTAWAFYSNIDNWRRIEGDSTQFEVDGPFQTGTHITAKAHGQDPRHSTLTEVEPPARVVVQMDLNEAVLRFTWTFEELPDNRTRHSTCPAGRAGRPGICANHGRISLQEHRQGNGEVS